MQASHRFFSNRECRYFPCHASDPERFNCLFCYCPLYLIPECGGNPRYLPSGVKDCSACARPHAPEAYDDILAVLRRHLADRTARASKEDAGMPGANTL